MTTYFISGHLDVNMYEFSMYYAKSIDAAIAEGAGFVVGDASGTDRIAQQYIADRIDDMDRVIVFHMLELPRFAVSRDFSLQGGFPNDESRDRAMTAASDKDIAWVRPGREMSGTAANLKRRITHV